MSDGKRNALNWFEIPAGDFNRAKKFYETILGSTMHTTNMGGADMAFFPADEGQVSGSVIYHPHMRPGMDGTTVYLNGNPDLATVLARVEPAGGKVIAPKTRITPEIGYFAMFLDTEGNKVALHSQN